MGRFHHSKKAHSEGKGKKNSKFTIAKREIRSWKTISFTRRSIRTFGILFAIFWMKDLPKKS
jgi:hypothetical protein